MMRYIGSVENLCLMMNLLRDEANTSSLRLTHLREQLDAVSNKPAPVRSILSMNGRR